MVSRRRPGIGAGSRSDKMEAVPPPVHIRHGRQFEGFIG
jgi:hypothetical protein